MEFLFAYSACGLIVNAADGFCPVSRCLQRVKWAFFPLYLACFPALFVCCLSTEEYVSVCVCVLNIYIYIHICGCTVLMRCKKDDMTDSCTRYFVTLLNVNSVSCLIFSVVTISS